MTSTGSQRDTVDAADRDTNITTEASLRPSQPPKPNDDTNLMPPPPPPAAAVTQDEPVLPPPPWITFAPNVKPFAPTPLIADLLRTRYCIPNSVFLVEGLEVPSLPRSDRWRVVRMMLGDGVLCIQALLAPEMHRFVDTGGIAVGAYVRLPRFSTRRRRIAVPGDRSKKKMVYLVVSDIVTVGWHDELRPPPRARVAAAKGDKNMQERQLQDAGYDHREEDEYNFEEDFMGNSDMELEEIEDAHAQALAQSDFTFTPPHIRTRAARYLDRHGEEPDDDEAFETMVVTPTRSAQRRERIAKLPASMSTNLVTRTRHKSPTKSYQHRDPLASAKHVAVTRRDTASPSRSPSRAPKSQAESQHVPVALARQWTDPSIPLKLTPLGSINQLPYKQNWSINTLVIVASLGEVEPSHIPPYSQRIARLADPTTDKQVMLAVLLDPHEFVPRIGSAVLLVGVKNHLFDGGSLKKYVSDKPTTQGGRWWFQDPSQFDWCDAEGLQKWWDDGHGSLRAEGV
ncbi:hypothetical protein ACHAQA_003722 [Verticillium albo-atrum]